MLPHQAGFHPGPNNEMASYEFVAPSSGDYSLSAEFSGRDYVHPTDTQVSIVDGYGTTPIFVGVVNGLPGAAASPLSVLRRPSHSMTPCIFRRENSCFSMTRGTRTERDRADRGMATRPQSRRRLSIPVQVRPSIWLATSATSKAPSGIMAFTMDQRDLLSRNLRLGF